MLKECEEERVDGNSTFEWAEQWEPIDGFVESQAKLLDDKMNQYLDEVLMLDFKQATNTTNHMNQEEVNKLIKKSKLLKDFAVSFVKVDNSKVIAENEKEIKALSKELAFYENLNAITGLEEMKRVNSLAFRRFTEQNKLRDKEIERINSWLQKLSEKIVPNYEKESLSHLRNVEQKLIDYKYGMPTIPCAQRFTNVNDFLKYRIAEIHLQIANCNDLIRSANIAKEINDHVVEVIKKGL